MTHGQTSPVHLIGTRTAPDLLGGLSKADHAAGPDGVAREHAARGVDGQAPPKLGLPRIDGTPAAGRQTQILQPHGFIPAEGHVDLCHVQVPARIGNTRLFKGKLHFQALGTNFRVWSDGIVSPLFEEMKSTAQLIAKEYEDREGRMALLNDPEWVELYRKEWMHGRTGGDFASWKTKKGFPDSLVIRDGSMLIFDGAPVSEWDGESMADVMARVQRYLGGDSGAARSDAEREAFDLFPKVLRDDADFMLHMMRTYDKSFRFYADIANKDNKATLGFLLDEHALPGFNDSGAHITNMAFFDSNLMSLKLAKERDEATVAHMVKRLTSEPAEIFGLDVGSLEIGAQADMVLINPDALDGWQPDQTRKLEYREIFGHEQMVNRPEGIVDSVYINGVVAWKDGAAQAALGQKTLGRALRAA